MKKLVFLIALLLAILVQPIRANQQWHVYVISGGKVVCDGMSVVEPSIGWNGQFFTFHKGEQQIKTLNCSVMWSVEPILFDPRVIQP